MAASELPEAFLTLDDAYAQLHDRMFPAQVGSADAAAWATSAELLWAAITMQGQPAQRRAGPVHPT